eukprot:Em0001g926a
MASQATTDLSLTMKAELCAYAHTSRHDCWAVVNVKAPLFKPETRVPIDVVAVIDVSRSMAKVKLKLVKQALLFFIGQRMKEIAYNSDPEKTKVKSVLLLTDGLPSVGAKTKEEVLAKMMQIQNSQEEKAAKKKFDGTVYTFGFGANHDAGMLAAISTQGGGVYYFIDSNEKIPESFADCLGGLQTVLGQNLSLELAILGENQLYYVHSSHTGNWTSVNKSWKVSLGDIQYEERRDIVMNLILPALGASRTECVLKATLSYFNVISSSMQTISCDLVVNRTDTAPGVPDADLDQQRNRVVAASTLKLAKALADQETKIELVSYLIGTVIP